MKQDRQGVRTPADIERKYDLGQDVSKVAKMAADAQRAAERASMAVDELSAKVETMDSGGMTWTKLWENEDYAGNSFSEQTINLDLSGYNMVMLQMFDDSESLNTSAVFLEVGDSVGVLVGGAYNAHRFVTVQSTGVVFGAGLVSESYGDVEEDSAKNDWYAIPWRIYGIKGVS